MLNHSYYSDPFLTTLDTDVIEVRPTQDRFHIILADTIFYPTGGGQPHDAGQIGDAQVLDVFEEDGQVVHVVDREVPHGKVTLTLDWERRFYHMQHHTGQHLLSAEFSNRYGWATQGFHLGENYTTIDITTPELTEEVIQEVEQAVNQVIYEDRPIQAYLVTPEQAAQLPVRKAPTVSEDIRIVEISGLDYSPCAGTHLKSTGQIGLLKIIKTEKYKGMTRVYFLCGQRALADYVEKHRIAQEISSALSTAIPELSAKVQSELAARHDLEDQFKKLQQKLWEYQAKELVAEAEGKTIFYILEDDSIEEAQALARQITTLGEYFVVIQTGSRIVLAQSLGQDPHCGNLIREHAHKLGGKGGGSPHLAQVFFHNSCELEQFRQFLQDFSQILSK